MTKEPISEHGPRKRQQATVVKDAMAMGGHRLPERPSSEKKPVVLSVRKRGRPSIAKETMVIGVRLPTEVVRELDAVVASRGRLLQNRSEVIREIVDRYLSISKLRKGKTKA